MDFDEILLEIGEFGRYQKTNFLLICLPVMFAAANSLSYVFTAASPAYRCLIDECEDSLNAQLDPPWLPNAVPGKTDTSGRFIAETCRRYRSNITYHVDEDLAADLGSKENFCPKEMFIQRSVDRCYEWVYDHEERTIVQEWEVTCSDNSWLLALVGTMHFAGLVVGTAMSGYLADRFGRKVIFIICIIFMAITGVAQGLSWSYNSFLVFAFLNAVGTSGVYPLAFILGVEMVGPQNREMSSNVLNYFYAVGEAFVGLSAWLLHDWQYLQYALSGPPLIFIIYHWFVPESVRWLLAKNQREKASVIIKKAAQINKRDLSVALLANFEDTTADHQVCTKGNKEGSSCFCSRSTLGKSQDGSDIWATVKEVFKARLLLLRYAVIMYIWIINAIVFYGLSLNSTNLSGNKYLNFSLVCLIEIPGYTLAWVSLKKFGRRLSLTGSLLLCAITCASGGYITKGTTWMVITFFLIGKLGITSSFAVIYTYTAEMMPTVIRSGGVGVMSTAARFGAMLAPFVPLLSIYYEALPLLLFGAASLSAGLLALILPETFRKKLPNSVSEATQLGKDVGENDAPFDHVAQPNTAA